MNVYFADPSSLCPSAAIIAHTEVNGLRLTCRTDETSLVHLDVGMDVDALVRLRIRSPQGRIVCERLLRQRAERVRFSASPGHYGVELDIIGLSDPESSRDDWRREIGLSVDKAPCINGARPGHTTLVVG